MTEPAAPTATAQPPQSRTQVARGKIPEEIKAAIELRRAQNIVAADIAATNWGKGMDLNTRRAIAEWGRRHAIDVTKEIDVLGGRIYLNAQFYFNRLARYIADDLVEYVVADHVEKDDRLLQLGDAGRAEAERRLRERIHFQLPDIAVSAVVGRIKFKNTPVEFTAAKWCGNRGTNKNGNLKDPIGEEFPVETSETRAIRRTCRFLFSYLPKAAQEIAEMERSAEGDLGLLIERDAQQQRIDAAHTNRLPTPIAAAPADDPYGVISSQGRLPRKGEAIEVPQAETKVTPAAEMREFAPIEGADPVAGPWTVGQAPPPKPPAPKIGGPRESEDFIDDTDLEARHENREGE